MQLLQIGIKDSSIQSNLPGNVIPLLDGIWFYIAIGELIIIITLIICLIYIKRSKKVSKFDNDIRQAKETTINMDELMLNINKSKELYKELSRKCHPDKHIESEFQKEIEELFQEITKNKRNFQELLKLKEIAINKYNIKID